MSLKKQTSLPLQTATFESDLGLFFREILGVVRKKPLEVVHYIKVAWWQRQAYKKRKKAVQERGLVVPPVLIASLTRRCNLTCSGCYARSLPQSKGQELSTDEFRRVLEEAFSLGVGIVFLAGGEPLMRPDLIALTEQFRKMQFLLFTNGVLLDAAQVKKLKKQKNCFPMLSLEGESCTTDLRRGEGVFKKIENGMTMLQKAGMFFGVSITVTAENRTQVTDRAFIGNLIDRGCKLFIFVGYIPVDTSTTASALSIDEHDALNRDLVAFRRELSALFVTFPGDEEKYGGCLSSGRGFVHLSASGEVEPCPFSPFSDVTIRGKSLEQVLRSPLLKTIRDNRHMFDERGGVCALFEHREWVEEKVKEGRFETGFCDSRLKT